VEKEYLRKAGSRVPVLVAAAAVAGAGARMETVAFVVDLRERKAAEEALLRAREELARVTRVSALGELAASIAHEINQPLAAVATYAGAALQWLGRDTPNVDRARDAVERTVQENEHAGKIVSRVRALVKKVPSRTEPLGRALKPRRWIGSSIPFSPPNPMGWAWDSPSAARSWSPMVAVSGRWRTSPGERFSSSRFPQPSPAPSQKRKSPIPRSRGKRP